MTRTRKATARRTRTRIGGDVGRMLGELEGRTGQGEARTRVWTQVQPANVKSGKVCA